MGSRPDGLRRRDSRKTTAVEAVAAVPLAAGHLAAVVMQVAMGSAVEVAVPLAVVAWALGLSTWH